MISALLLAFVLILSYGFVFVAFRTFTVQDQNVVTTAINACIVVAMFGFAFYLATRHQDEADLIEQKARRIEKALSEIMKFTSNQIKMATLMMNQVDLELRGYSTAEESYSADDDDDGSEQLDLPLTVHTGH